MLDCFLDGVANIGIGDLIEIRRGTTFEERLRVMEFYNITKKNHFVFPNIQMGIPIQEFDPPIIGMINSSQNIGERIDFNIKELKSGLSSFNVDTHFFTNTFISSRIEELQDERKMAIIGTFEGESIPVYWEKFPPTERPAPAEMIRYLETCHIYLGIFASQYSEPTETEYRRSVELGMPILCFVKRVEERENRLLGLIKEFQDDDLGIIYNEFETPRELQHLVKNSVGGAIDRLFE